ncbi:hypothetical protein [uncultured Nitrospira sp.]|uniref:hypothetical protein n=1 Tax=uncultured Nitrospira sp. TaxID=157176 RepID=UPI0031405CEE
MWVPNDLHHFPDPAAPVFRPGEFKGREGLVRNVLWRLERGESLSLVGGPKLGKTSLLLHLAWQLNHAGPSPKSTGPAALYVDVANEADWKRFHSRPPNPDTIVFLDNCDRLAEGETRSLSDIDLLPGGSTVFAGARAWREVVRGGGLPHTLKSIPLAVFLEKEAQQLFSPELSTEQQASVLIYAGTHPYILKVLQAELLRAGPSVRTEQVVKDVKKSLSSFFQDCVNQMREPLEHQVLACVIEAGKPVNPKEVARAVGLPTIKPVADTLCALGLIGRWIRDEAATLSAGSRLFNEWYRETVAF